MPKLEINLSLICYLLPGTLVYISTTYNLIPCFLTLAALVSPFDPYSLNFFIILVQHIILDQYVHRVICTHINSYIYTYTVKYTYLCIQ